MKDLFTEAQHNELRSFAHRSSRYWPERNIGCAAITAIMALNPKVSKAEISAIAATPNMGRRSPYRPIDQVVRCMYDVKTAESLDPVIYGILEKSDPTSFANGLGLIAEATKTIWPTVIEQLLAFEAWDRLQINYRWEYATGCLPYTYVEGEGPWVNKPEGWGYGAVFYGSTLASDVADLLTACHLTKWKQVNEVVEYFSWNHLRYRRQFWGWGVCGKTDTPKPLRCLIEETRRAA